MPRISQSNSLLLDDHTGFVVGLRSENGNEYLFSQVIITGRRRVGEILTARPGGNWSFTAGQWYRTPIGGTATAISGATALTYTLVDADADVDVSFIPTSPVETSLPQRIAAGVPGQVTGLTLSLVASNIAAAFALPSATGGAALTFTRVTFSNGYVVDVPAPGTSATAPGILGVPTTATAVAYNRQGAGPVSAVSNSVTPIVAPVYLTSASTRAVLPVGAGTAGANNFRTTRQVDYAVSPVSNPVFDFANLWVNVALTAAAQEVAGANVVPYAAALIPNPTGSALNQSAANIIPLTFQNAAAGVAGYLTRINAAIGGAAIAATAAEFTAAGGTISGDFQTIGIPGGYVASADPVAGITLSGFYFIQTEISPAVGAQYMSSTVRGVRADLGDQIKDSTARTGVYVKDWTTLGVTSSGATHGPIAVHGTSASGVKSTGVAGDSIFNDNFDRNVSTQLYGDAQGATCTAGRALNAAGRPFVRVAISSANSFNPYTYGGYSIRRWMLRHCFGVITDMGHNDRGQTFSNVMIYLRAHYAQLRGGMAVSTGKVIQSTWNPLATLVSYAISAITSAGTVATATTASTSNMAAGRTIAITGAAPAAFNGAAVVVQSIVDATHFTYNIADQSGASATTPGSFTDLWATKAGQAPATIAGSMQFDSFNPFMRAGVFNGTTDCDGCYDMGADIYTAATAISAGADVTPGYVPTDGIANHLWNDSTHMTGIMHTQVSTYLTPSKLTAMLGY